MEEGLAASPSGRRAPHGCGFAPPPSLDDGGAWSFFGLETPCLLRKERWGSARTILGFQGSGEGVTLPPPMKVALGQFDAIVGDIRANTASIERLAARAADLSADLLVLPEMCLLGYPPRDLLLREEVVPACEAAIGSLAERLPLPALVGSPRMVDGGSRPIANSIAFCREGRVEGWHDKILLPTYDVFDENRWFQSGEEPLVFDHCGMRVGVLVCEDLWRAMDVGVERPYRRDPVDMAVKAGCQLLVSPSASPFIVGKHARHMTILKDVSRTAGLPLVMANQVGANDDLVFDGGSIAFSQDGECICSLPRFQEAVGVCDLVTPNPVDAPEALCQEEEHYRAVTEAIRGYCSKTSHGGVLLGLSGGIDSALVAALAVAALGPDAVQVVLMPGRHSSEGSLRDARDSAERLGIKAVQEIPIGTLHGSLKRRCRHRWNVVYLMVLPMKTSRPVCGDCC